VFQDSAIKIYPPKLFDRLQQPARERTHVLGLLHTCTQTKHEARSHLFLHCTFDLALFDFLSHRQYHYKFNIPWPQQEVQLIKLGGETVNIIRNWGTKSSIVPKDCERSKHWLCGFRRVQRVVVMDIQQGSEITRRIKALRHWFQDEQLEVVIELRLLRAPLWQNYNLGC
jgi:hypothetical protein